MNKWLYKEEDDHPNVRLPLDQYGNGFKMLKNHDYEGTIGLGAHAQGIIEPIPSLENPEN